MSKRLMFVGSNNRAAAGGPPARGKGISVYRLDLDTAAAELLSVFADVDNPSFLAVAPDGKSLAAVNERPGVVDGSISGLAVDGEKLRMLGSQSTGGFTPAHASYDNTGRFVAAINYADVPATEASRSVMIYPVAGDGSIGPAVGEATHRGKGKDPSRQDRPHAHCVRWTPDNRFVVVADLGLDKLVVYRFDAATGDIAPHSELVVPAGSGPRHFAFHPSLPFAYLVNEMNSTVASLAFDAAGGSFRLLAMEATLATGASYPNYCSAIAVTRDGRHVFAGNRGHDSIARFDIDGKGIARFIRTTPCGGKWPRDFAFDPSGSLLVVANQQSDIVSLFRYDAATGNLTPAGAIACGAPMAIAFQPD